jgi:hypothetical protein
VCRRSSILTEERGRDGGGAWAFINHSVLSGQYVQSSRYTYLAHIQPVSSRFFATPSKLAFCVGGHFLIAAAKQLCYTPDVQYTCTMYIYSNELTYVIYLCSLHVSNVNKGTVPRDCYFLFLGFSPNGTNHSRCQNFYADSEPAKC